MFFVFPSLPLARCRLRHASNDIKVASGGSCVGAERRGGFCFICAAEQRALSIHTLMFSFIYYYCPPLYALGVHGFSSLFLSFVAFASGVRTASCRGPAWPPPGVTSACSVRSLPSALQQIPSTNSNTTASGPSATSRSSVRAGPLYPLPFPPAAFRGAASRTTVVCFPHAALPLPLSLTYTRANTCACYRPVSPRVLSLPLSFPLSFLLVPLHTHAQILQTSICPCLPSSALRPTAAAQTLFATTDPQSIHTHSNAL